MEIRRCGHTHFIQAIRGGLVIKVRNTDCHGRPALSFKTLKDVCESIDAKTICQPPTINSHSTQAGLPMVGRTLRGIKPGTDEFVAQTDGLDRDLDDSTTLRQLKDRFLTKKRKINHSDEHRNLVHEDANPVEDKPHLNLLVVGRTLREIKSEKDEFVPNSGNGLDSDSDAVTTLTQLTEKFREKKRKFGGEEVHSTLAYSTASSVEDESDLNEPIISLKSKDSRRSKTKRKCMKGNGASSSTTAFNIKCELNVVSEGSQRVGSSDLAPVIRIKVEDDTKELESPRKTSFPGDSLFRNDEVPCPGGDLSNGFEFEKPLSVEECENCVTNEISYDHLEYVEPISVFVPSDGMNDELETPELHCHEVLEEISEQCSSSGVQDLDMTTDCTVGCIGLCDDLNVVQFEDNFKADSPHEQDNSLRTPDKNCSSSQNSVTSLRTDGCLVPMIIPDKEHSITCNLDDRTENGLNSGTNINDELLNAEEKEVSASPITNAESQSSPKNQSVGCADTVSTTEPCRPPERLLSTRTAISPSSQERLSSAMNSVEHVDQYIGSERKGQLCEGETGKKASPARSDIHHAQRAVVNGRHVQVSQRKVYISSRHLTKKSQNSKANLEGPRFARILPNLSTECTSIQGCSESAVAFSQRQMQDMESLAFKLMDELASMKCIVEQKLLFEAYRSVPLKSEADEVKSAISSASKMEETARRWLSTMARDCKRFCKIMKMTPNASPASKDAVPRERRKIAFADEAGGKLCHVRFFEAGVTPPVFDGVEQ